MKVRVCVCVCAIDSKQVEGGRSDQTHSNRGESVAQAEQQHIGLHPDEYTHAHKLRGQQNSWGRCVCVCVCVSVPESVSLNACVCLCTCRTVCFCIIFCYCVCFRVTVRVCVRESVCVYPSEAV